jgi:2'-5' RNA ligase
MNQARPSRRTSEPNAPYLFGTIHAVLPESSPAAAVLAGVRSQIAEADLAGRGLDTGPIHITLRYGVQGDDISAIKSMLAAHTPICALLGATSSFPPSTASPGVAVIFAGIQCPELHVLNRRLAEAVDFIETAYTYEPHVTIAYVRPEVAQKYVGNQITAGHTFVIEEVIIRTKSKDETIVTLAG